MDGVLSSHTNLREVVEAAVAVAVVVVGMIWSVMSVVNLVILLESVACALSHED